MSRDLIPIAAEILADCRNILVFTGAGVSTESGIPDFRGPDGLWARVDPADFTIDRYLTTPDVRIRRWERHRSGALWGPQSAVRPNPAHIAITRLYEAGQMTGCITQNVDGLHSVAGLPENAVAEVHGNVHRSACIDCGLHWATEEVLAWVEDGMADPRCPTCGGIVKVTTVMFGDALPPGEIDKATTFSGAADAVLVVGSTMSVYPATDFALRPVRRGAPLVIINRGPTEHDESAAALIDEAAGTAVPSLVNRLIA